MAITKEKAIDILDKIDFFQGQRAGRELWNEKPLDVQEMDLRNFQKDVAMLKEYINAADVVPREEVEKIFAEIDSTIELVCAMTGLNITIFGKFTELKKKYIGYKRKEDGKND